MALLPRRSQDQSPKPKSCKCILPAPTTTSCYHKNCRGILSIDLSIDGLLCPTFPQDSLSWKSALPAPSSCTDAAGVPHKATLHTRIASTCGIPALPAQKLTSKSEARPRMPKRRRGAWLYLVLLCLRDLGHPWVSCMSRRKPVGFKPKRWAWRIQGTPLQPTASFILRHFVKKSAES